MMKPEWIEGYIDGHWFWMSWSPIRKTETRLYWNGVSRCIYNLNYEQWEMFKARILAHPQLQIEAQPGREG